jgi:Tfp pilus assembly protein PilF
MGDVLSLQSEVARALVQEIRVTVTPSEEARLGRTRSVDPEAYQLYLKGNYLMLQMLQTSYERARDAYQQAIERDPRFAPAYAGLAMAHIEIGGWFGSVDPREVKARAKEAIDRALEVDDTAADAYMALGTYEYNFEWDWARAERAFQKGLELTPSSSYARINYANFLTHMGRFDDSIALGRQTLAIDPLSPAAHDELPWAMECSRRDGEVLALFQKALELDPNFPAHMIVSIHYFRKGTTAGSDRIRGECGTPRSRADDVSGLSRIRLRHDRSSRGSSEDSRGIGTPTRIGVRLAGRPGNALLESG